MKAVRLAPQGAGYGDLRVLDEDMPSPGHGEVLVRIRAASLNPHDDFVVRGVLPAREGVVPLTDGAGEVAACGEGVDDLRPGDAVVSVFWPHWEDGRPTAAMRRDVPGEMVDGFAREYTCLPARATGKIVLKARDYDSLVSGHKYRLVRDKGEVRESVCFVQYHQCCNKNDRRFVG
jgi:NADPH:quinone reductase-like Zn-dependent oxidoreductase